MFVISVIFENQLVLQTQCYLDLSLGNFHFFKRGVQIFFNRVHVYKLCESEGGLRRAVLVLAPMRKQREDMRPGF